MTVGNPISRIASAVAGLVWLCAIGSVAAAGEPLDSWVRQALERNQEVIAAREAWTAARQQAPRARSLRDPMLGVDFMRMDQTRLDDVDMTEVMLSQQIPWFGKRRAGIDAAERRAQASGLRYLETRRAVQTEVVAAYWNLWAAQRAIVINGAQRELIEQFEAVARVRYEAGGGLQADLLRAQVEQDRLDNEAVNLQQQREVAQARLNRLLSAPPDTLRSVDDPPDPDPVTANVQELQAQARARYLPLQAARREIAAREAGLRAARLDNAPDFEFRVMARQYSGRSGIQEIDTGVAINVPWLWRGKYTAATNAARAERDRAQADYLNRLDRLAQEVTEAYAAVDAARRSIRLLETTVLPRTGELVESTRAAYEGGRVSLLELVTAQRTWEDAALTLDRARARYAADVARLSALTGAWTAYEQETGLLDE